VGVFRWEFGWKVPRRQKLRLPKRVIADRARDSDPLRERLKKRGNEDGSSNPPTPGGVRRLLVRHEHLLIT
jgi:hypothetical protein